MKGNTDMSNGDSNFWAAFKPYIQLIVWAVMAAGWAYTVKATADDSVRRVNILEVKIETADEVRYQLQEMVAKQSKDIEYMRQSIDRIEKKLDRR
jgi:uncharacterized coiled-coil protein SlyX